MSSKTANSVEALHQQAMEYCERAILARKKSDSERSAALFKEAFEREQKAALLLTLKYDLEPTRSVLHRSAASLALECGETRAAEKLIASALVGEPPDAIADELRNLLEQVHFERHLEVRGVELAEDEFQLSISGASTGHGMAPADQFVGRVQTSEKLIIRTIERKSGRPFREGGKASGEISTNFELYLSVPRAASFAVTLRVGRPQKQKTLPGFEPSIIDQPTAVIDELFECLRSYESNSDLLNKLIPDETYRRNFVALAEKLAPDGERVKQVGLTALRDGHQVRVALRKTRQDTRESDRDGAPPPLREVKEVTGTLLLANSKSDHKRIEVIDDDRRSHSFIVPEGMMVDIVKPLWEERVTAKGILKGRTLLLQKIKKAPLSQS